MSSNIWLWLEWEKSHYANTLKDTKMFLAYDDTCLLFKRGINTVTTTAMPNFRCTREEADTMLVYHLSKLTSEKNIVIRSNDSDILIILLFHLQKR